MTITDTHKINTLLSQQPQGELETPGVNHFYDDLSNYKAEVSGTGTVSKETENNGKRSWSCDVTESKLECTTDGDNPSESNVQKLLEEQPPAVPER